MAESVKILHWNVWHRTDRGQIVERIAEIDPDIACLTEVARDSSRRPGANLDEQLKDELGFTDSFYQAANILHAKRSQEWVEDGNGIYSKFPLIETSAVQLSSGGWDAKYYGDDYRRFYVGATAVLPSMDKLGLGVVHLSLLRARLGNRQVHRQEADKLTDIVKRVSGNYVLTGDWNASKRRPPVSTVSRYLDRVGGNLDQPTWQRTINLGLANLTLRKCLDHVFVSPDVSVINADVLPAEPSDHHPLLVEVEVGH